MTVVVDSAGQYLLTYPLNADGSVTAKLKVQCPHYQLPLGTRVRRQISHLVLTCLRQRVVLARPEFEAGYTFNSEDPNIFKFNVITIFDDLGNPTILPCIS